jgi:hypothetical protein
MDKMPMSSVAKGLIISAILIAYSCIIGALGQNMNPDLAMIPLGILLVSAILSGVYFAKQTNGNTTQGGIFLHVFKMTALVAAMFGLWIAISLKFNLFHVMDQALEMTRQSLVKSGALKPDEIEDQLKIAKGAAAPMGTIMNVVMYLFIGAIGSIIAAVFSKRNPNYIPVQKDR